MKRYGKTQALAGLDLVAVLWSGMGAAAGVAEDVEHGFVDRLRSLPIPRAAVARH